MDDYSHRGPNGLTRQPPEAQTSLNRQRLTYAPQLTFINTDASQQVVKPNRLSQIRSHVAKDMHARARQKRIDNLQVRTLPPKSRNVSNWSSAANAKPQAAQSKQCEVKDISTASPKTAVFKETDMLRRVARIQPTPSPQAPVGCGRTFAREINETERYMLKCFVDFTDSHGNSMQKAIKDHEALSRKLKSLWVPYSMNKSALIDTLFLKAAYILAVKTKNDSQQRWDLVACAYKQKCLRSAIDAIEREGNCPQDETIALVVSIAANDYIMGDWNGWVLHGRGAIELVKKRGGLHTLRKCLDGLLTQMVAWSVFNPRFKIVQGPDPEELLEIPEFQPAC